MVQVHIWSLNLKKNDSTFIGIPSKIRKVMSWPLVHLPTKFRGNRVISFFHNPAGPPTKHETNSGDNMTSMVEAIAAAATTTTVTTNSSSSSNSKNIY